MSVGRRSVLILLGLAATVGVALTAAAPRALSLSGDAPAEPNPAYDGRFTFVRLC